MWFEPKLSTACSLFFICEQWEDVNDCFYFTLSFTSLLDGYLSFINLFFRIDFCLPPVDKFEWLRLWLLSIEWSIEKVTLFKLLTDDELLKLQSSLGLFFAGLPFYSKIFLWTFSKIWEFFLICCFFAEGRGGLNALLALSLFLISTPVFSGSLGAWWDWLILFEWWGRFYLSWDFRLRFGLAPTVDMLMYFLGIFSFMKYKR
jgi:hypothetical protein